MLSLIVKSKYCSVRGLNVGLLGEYIGFTDFFVGESEAFSPCLCDILRSMPSIISRFKVIK